MWEKSKTRYIKLDQIGMQTHDSPHTAKPALCQLSHTFHRRNQSWNSVCLCQQFPHTRTKSLACGSHSTSVALSPGRNCFPFHQILKRNENVLYQYLAHQRLHICCLEPRVFSTFPSCLTGIYHVFYVSDFALKRKCWDIEFNLIFCGNSSKWYPLQQTCSWIQNWR